MPLSYYNGVSDRLNNEFIYLISLRFTRAIIFSIFPAPKKSINDEIVLITGSAGNLGRALAVEFSKYGAFLCLWDTDEVENQKTYELLYTKYNHRRMVAMKVDITFVDSQESFPLKIICLSECLKKFIVLPKRFDRISATFRLSYKMQVERFEL